MILKNIFNKCLGEKRKEQLRRKFASFFILYDKKLYKKTYNRMLKYILKQKIDNANGYGYRKDSFLAQVKEEYVKYLILNDEETRGDSRYKECLEYIKKYGVRTFCHDGIDYNIYNKQSVHYDDEKQLFWVYYRNKKLYMKRSINTEEAVLEVINMLAAEQEEASPHRYINENFEILENDVVFDIGCAEGNFALSVIDAVKKIYMFEADEEWIEALNCTFEPYKEKIMIIPKYVSDRDTEESITVDSFCRANGIEKIDFVKMDVEGAEPDVLRGAREMIKKGSIAKIAACTYHNAEDETKIRELLKAYDCQVTQGFMQVAERNEIWDIKKPFFLPVLLQCRYIGK